jgi:DNA-binding CsgD family transcriptional regulator
MTGLADFLDATIEAKNPDDLTRGFSRFLSGFGIEGFTMSVLSSDSSGEREKGFDRLANYPLAWIERYKAMHYAEHDPVYLTAIRGIALFTWEEAQRRVDTEESRRVMDESRDFGLANGIGLTIRHSLKEIVGFGFSSSDPDMRTDRKALRSIQLGAYHCLLSYDELCRPEAEERKAILSDREKDALSWIASGKTKAETADILAVSESCVKRHCENAFAKLEANSLPQAVATALKRGLIDPF